MNIYIYTYIYTYVCIFTYSVCFYILHRLVYILLDLQFITISIQHVLFKLKHTYIYMLFSYLYIYLHMLPARSIPMGFLILTRRPLLPRRCPDIFGSQSTGCTLRQARTGRAPRSCAVGMVGTG